MSIIYPRLFEQLNPKAKPLLDTRPINPTYYLEDGTRNILFYTRDYSKGGNLIPSSTGGGNFIPQRPLTTALQPYTQKTLSSKRVRVFDYINPEHEVIPIVPYSWVPNTILEASMIVHPDGTPRQALPQGAILNPAEIQNRIMMAEASGNPALAEQIKQKYDPTAVAQDKLRERIQKLRDEGDYKQADILQEKYFPEQHRHQKQLDAIGGVGRSISKIKISIEPVKPMEKAIEAKFNEILANRPTDIVDEMKKADQEIQDRIDALKASGDPIPPELETFKKRLEKFDAGSFSKKFGDKPNVNPRKLSDTNREALENLARFLEGRSPTGSPTASEAGSRRSSVSSVGSAGGDDYPIMLKPALGQSSLDDWKNLMDSLGNPKGISALNAISDDDFKDVRRFAQNFLSKKEFDNVEKDYENGRINKAQYVIANISLGVENLKQYILKGKSSLKGSPKSSPKGSRRPSVEPSWNVDDPKVLVRNFNENVDKGLKVDDIVSSFLLQIDNYYSNNKSDLERNRELMRDYKRNVVALAVKSLGKGVNAQQIDNFIRSNLGNLKKPQTIFNKAVKHFSTGATPTKPKRK